MAGIDDILYCKVPIIDGCSASAVTRLSVVGIER